MALNLITMRLNMDLFLLKGAPVSVAVWALVAADYFRELDKNKKGPSYGAFSIYLGKSSNQSVTADSELVPSYASGPRPQDPKFVPRLVM